ncbi:MAG: ABC transporter permease [Saprospiraceae bacterium]
MMRKMIGWLRGKNSIRLVTPARPQSYWGIVKRQFRNHRLANWALRGLYLFIFIAFFGDFLANDKPIYCKIDNEHHFPVFREYAVNLGLASWKGEFFRKDWDEHDYQTKWMPPIPYSSTSLDRKNTNSKSPFGPQKIENTRYWHWLGTDDLGRDVAAGLIKGARVAMQVGIVSMLIATLIGVFLGTLAGYFGDYRLQISRARILCNGIAVFLSYFYGIQTRLFVLQETKAFGWELCKSIVLILFFFSLLNVLVSLVKKIPFFAQKMRLPIDLIIMRTIEILNSIPGLLLILSIVAILDKPSIFYLMIFIGLIGWTGIARFIRAEMLRIRQLDYIQAAQSIGLKDWQIMLQHAIPNALTPVLITIAFGIAGAILLESTLSFLGVGVQVDAVTWGALLREARSNFSAWWLAIFPGLAIFVTVSLFNLVGEGLADAMDPNQKR